MTNRPNPFRKPLISSAAALLVGSCLTWAWLGRGGGASAQPAPANHEHGAVAPEVHTRIDQLLALFGQGKIDDMLQRMPVPSGGSRDEYENQRRQLAALYGVAGRYAGFDIVGTQTLTPRYHEVYVLAYFEKEPALFQFGFYRPGNDWQVLTFKVRTDFAQFLDLLPLQRP